MISLTFSLALMALGLALVALPLLNLLARSCGWVDAPDERKAHVGSIPLTGGATIALSAILALIWAGLIWPEFSRPLFSLIGGPVLPWPVQGAGLLVGLAICFAIGFWDDRFPLRARYRLVAQLLAAGAAVVGGTVLTSMGNTFFPVALSLSVFAIPFTVVAMTGLVNAYNMSDGLDGLCGGYAAVALAAFALCAALVASEPAPGAAAALTELGPVILPSLGAVLGFLVYNLRHPWRDKAASFLGDAGSMSLGFLIGWIAVRLASGYGEHSLPPATALWIVALPLIDMFACMIRRPLEGRTPMSADRRHLHHMLMEIGMSVRQAVATLLAVAATFSLIGIASWQLHVPAYWLFWTLIAVFIGYTVFSIQFWRRRDAPSYQQGAAAPSAVSVNSGAAVGESRGFST